MALELQVMIVYKACSFALCFKTWMTVHAWSGLVRMVVKHWTRASRVSVGVQPDTPENTARQVGYADSRFWINIVS